MPVIIGKKRGGKGGFKSGSEGILEYSETVVYHVEAESATTTKQDVLLTAGLPIVNLSFLGVGPFGNAALCISKEAVQWTDNATRWDVTCEFSSAARRSEQQSETQQTSDPTTWTPQYTSFTEQIEVVLWKDKNGDPIVNPLGELYTEPVLVPVTIPGIRFLQYENNWSVDLLIERNDSVNSALFHGRAASELKLNIEEQKPVYKNGVYCHAISYAIRYHPRTWKVSRLRTATRYLDGSGDRVPFRDKEGNIITEGIVNEDGTKAASQLPIASSFDEYDAFDALDFNDFLRV